MTPSKSRAMHLPKVPDEFFPDFLRGYFDGDGNVYLGRHRRKENGKLRWVFSVRFISGSKQFLLGLWKSLRNHIRGGRLGAKKGGYELVFSHRDGLALFKLMYNNASATVFLERKHKTFQKAFRVLNMRA
jgi:hypothetical protein